MINTTDYKIFDLRKGFSNTFMLGNVIMYTIEQEGYIKQGEIFGDSYNNLTIPECINKRYSTQSEHVAPIKLRNVIIFDKVDSCKKNYDEGVRSIIHGNYVKGVSGLDAYCPGHRGNGENTELLLGYDSTYDEYIIECTKEFLDFSGYINTNPPFIPRWGQEDVINEAISNLSISNNTTISYHTGGGKSILSAIVALHSIPEGEGAGILVTTPMTSTVTSFTKAIDSDVRLGKFDQKYSYMTRESYDPIEYSNRIADGEVVFLIVTAQGYFHVNERFIDSAHLFDIWIIDERHFLYEGIKTSKKISNLNIPITINLTATPQKILDKVSNIISRGMCWAIQNREHTKFPIPHIASVGARMENSAFTGVNIPEGFHPEKYFQRNMDDNNVFTYGTSIANIAKLMYVDDSGPDINPLTIMDDRDLSDISKKVGLWVLPEGNSREYIPQLTQFLNDKVEGRLFLCAYDMGRDPDSFIRKKIAEGHKNITVLTCDMFIIGTDIPMMGHIVLWRSISDTSRFIQLIGRMQRVIEGKNATKIYCMAPKMNVENVIFKIAKEESDSNGTCIEEYLKCLPLTKYDLSGSITKLTATDILKDIHDSKYEGSSIDLSKFTSSMLDFDISGMNFVTPTPQTTSNAEVSADNGAQVKPHSPKDNPNEKKVPTVEELKRLIQSFTTELIWIAASRNETDVHLLKDDDRVVSMFPKSIDTIKSVINSVSGLDKAITDFLYMKLVALRNLEFRDIHGVLFNNTPEKKSLSCVYTPIQVAEALIDSNIEECYNRGARDFAIGNSLSGSMPYVLLEKYPDINLTCIEYFPYFIDHLKAKGYNVVHMPDPSTTTLDMKFDVIIANFPFDDANSSAKNGKLWKKFTDKCIDELLNTGGTMNIVSPTTILSKIKYGMKKVKQFSTTQSLVAIDYSVGEKYFSTIGCPICKWTMVDKPYYGKTVVTDIKGDYEFDIRVGDGLPMRPERMVLQSILDKIENSTHNRIPTKTGQQITGAEYKNNGKELSSSDIGTHPIYHSGKTVKYTYTVPTTGTGLKFVIPFSASHRSRFIATGNIGMFNAWCPIKNEEEGEYLMKIVDHPLIDLYITKQNRSINYESKRFTTTTGFAQVIRTNRLPYLESFDNLAEQFNLTSEEVEYLKGVGINV